MAVDDADVLITEVRRAASDAGLTQERLAEVWGVDQGRVSLLLRGKRGARITAVQLIALEGAAGLPPGEVSRRVAERALLADIEDHALAAADGSQPTPADVAGGSPVRRRGSAPAEQDDV